VTPHRPILKHQHTGCSVEDGDGSVGTELAAGGAMMAKQGQRIGTKAGDKGGGTPCSVAGVRVRGGGCIQIQHHSWWWLTVLAAAGDDRARHWQGGAKAEVGVGGDV